MTKKNWELGIGNWKLLSHSTSSQFRIPHSTFRIQKSGYSLLEVLVAITILSVGMVGLSTLTQNGQNKSVISRELSVAQQVCQTRINEILAGSKQLQTINDEPIPGLRDWTLSVALDTNQKQGILAVWVTAQRQHNDGGDLPFRRAGRFRIVQWMNVNRPPNPVSVSRQSARSSSYFETTSSPNRPRAGTLESLFSNRPQEPSPVSAESGNNSLPPLPLPGPEPSR